MPTVFQGSAALAGTGLTNPNSVQVQVASATLTGAGAVSGTPSERIEDTTTLGGVGSLGVNVLKFPVPIPTGPSQQAYSESPGTGHLSFTITPSDLVGYPNNVSARAIYVGGAGNVVLVNFDGSTTVWYDCPAGFIIPCWSIRVNNVVGGTTTATYLVGIT